MNLIFQIDEALVPCRDEVKEPWACFVGRLNDIRAAADRMPDIDAAADATTAALRTLPSLPSVQGCRDRRLSRA